MTSWESIQMHCQKLFGYKPTPFQVRFWWLGDAARGDAAKWDRKKWAVAEIGEWDVVVKLALSYTAQQLAKMNKKMKSEEISRFVYFILWKSHQVRIAEAKDSHGKIFNAPTFWGWAAEHRKQFEPVLSKKGLKSMHKALRTMVDVLDKQGG